MEEIKISGTHTAGIYGNPYPISEDLKTIKYGYRWYNIEEEETGNPYINLEDGTAVYFEIYKHS